MAGLTKEALAKRRQGIGGSDAPKILEGGEAWYHLWLDKTGRKEPEDLSGVFAVQLGLITEPLNLDWYERVVGHPVTRRGEVVVSKDYPILRCTLDGWDDLGSLVIQAKHVNGRSTLEEVTQRYRPQVCHEIFVTQAKGGVLSVIMGCNAPALVPIELDEFWVLEYLDRCREFWSYVESDKEPPGAPPAAPPSIPLDTMRVVDFSTNNFWAENADKWKKLAGASKAFHAAERELKAMVEADVKEAFGFGISIRRDKRGLHIKDDPR